MDWNDKKEFDQFVKLMMSMSTDYLMGGITKETYINNYIHYAGFMIKDYVTKSPEMMRIIRENGMKEFKELFSMGEVR